MKRANRATARGQSLIEFALVLPLLMLIAVMLLDLGRAVYYYSVVHNAAREGARYGIVHYNLSRDDLIANIIAAANDLAIGLDQDELTITPDVPAYPIESGDILEVTAEYSFEAVTPLVNLFIAGGVIDLHSSSTMYFEK